MNLFCCFWAWVWSWVGEHDCLVSTDWVPCACWDGHPFVLSSHRASWNECGERCKRLQKLASGLMNPLHRRTPRVTWRDACMCVTHVVWCGVVWLALACDQLGHLFLFFSFSGWMQRSPPNLLLNPPASWEWDQAQVMQVLDAITADNMLMFFISSSLSDADVSSVEPIYGTRCAQWLVLSRSFRFRCAASRTCACVQPTTASQGIWCLCLTLPVCVLLCCSFNSCAMPLVRCDSYSEVPLSTTLVSTWTTTTPVASMTLQQANPFIPHSFDLVPTSQNRGPATPDLVVNSTQQRVWWLAGSFFQVSTAPLPLALPPLLSLVTGRDSPFPLFVGVCVCACVVCVLWWSQLPRVTAVMALRFPPTVQTAEVTC